MPHPKRKISKTRRDKRRTHHKLDVPAIGKCPNCGEMKRHHVACPSCGYYNGRVMLKDTTPV